MKEVKVAIHQPNFIPWSGYFHKIKQADIFVLYDTAEYTKNSFINRNKILVEGKDSWLTIPIKYKGHSKKPINQIEIDNLTYHPEKIAKKLQQEYQDYPFFNHIMPDFHEHLKVAQIKLNLTDLNEQIIRWISAMLNINTTIIKASSLSMKKTSATMTIVDICRQCQADIYLSGKSGKNYLEEELFERSNLRLEYMMGSENPTLNSHLSILHWLFLEGSALRI